MLLSQIRPPALKVRSDVGDLEELKQSIREKGLLEPILVRPVKNHFEVVAGHRRYVAAIELGWTEIDAVSKEISDQLAFEIALVENIHRKSMDAIEEAQAFHKYVIDKGYGSASELAAKIGKTQQYVSSRLVLINLPKDSFQAVKSGKLSASHGEVLSTLNADKAMELTRVITNEASGKPFLDSLATQKAVNLIKRGADVEQAVEMVVEHPDWDYHKSVTRFDPIKMARDSMVTSLEKALIESDSNINRLADGEEKAKWIHEVRSPLHGIIDSAMKIRKEYGKR